MRAVRICDRSIGAPMSYSAPVQEQRFVLRHLAGVHELVGGEGVDGLSDESIEAVVEGVAAFAEGEFAPLSRLGDTVGAKWRDGIVTMPEGYKDAYRAFIENGWGSVS